MNVLLIDDHFCARAGVATLLPEIVSDLQVFEAESFEQGLLLAHEKVLNLALLDIQLPGKDGMTGLQELRKTFPSLGVVMFSGLDNRELVFESLRLGAMGFITKTLSRHAFIEALRDVLSGRVYLPPSVAGPQVSKQMSVDTGAHPVTHASSIGLTPREFVVLGWLVQGKCNKDIARKLGIEEQTVKNHLRPIFQKFGVTRRTELMVKVHEQGIVFGRPGADL